uniref:C-factor n=1 Tax=Xenopsylla cheopis TaxID=163159 RepID=A0A6M2DQ05_XENCH
MKSILITGCNRGLGLGLVKSVLKELNPKHIIATCRNVNSAGELQDIASKHQNVHIVELDVKNTESYNAVVETVSKIVGEDGLNVLFNNAGVSPRSTRLAFTEVDKMMDTFLVNTVAPVMLTKAFLPLLKKASDMNSTLPMGIARAAIINMSSALGSISENESGGLYPYRCAKAALNAATKSMSIDLKSDNILAVNMHPGWVKTDMGGKNAPLDVEDSVVGIVKTLAKLNEKDNGGFVQYDGKHLPW